MVGEDAVGGGAKSDAKAEIVYLCKARWRDMEAE